MSRHELEQRIRILEEGINRFEGMEWIVKVGEMAEMKSALFDMPDDLSGAFAPPPGAAELTALDGDIAIAVNHRTPTSEQRRAFHAAYEVLRRWLEPNFPGLRGRPRWTGYGRDGTASGLPSGLKPNGGMPRSGRTKV